MQLYLKWLKLVACKTKNSNVIASVQFLVHLAESNFSVCIENGGSGAFMISFYCVLRETDGHSGQVDNWICDNFEPSHVHFPGEIDIFVILSRT